MKQLSEVPSFIGKADEKSFGALRKRIHSKVRKQLCDQLTETLESRLQTQVHDYITRTLWDSAHEIGIL